MGLLRNSIPTALALLFYAGALHAGTYSFHPPAVAGATNATLVPNLQIRFAGDGVTVDSQADFTFDSSKFSATVSGANGGACAVLNQNHILVLAPVRSTPQPTAPTTWCRVTFTAKLGVPTDYFDLTYDPDNTLCVDAVGEIVDNCVVPDGSGVLIVGPLTPSPSVTYEPALNSTIDLETGSAQITANYVTGGQGGSAVIDSCAITGSAFNPVTMSAAPIAFISTMAGSAAIGVSCPQPSEGGQGTLTCMEAINPASPIMRSWVVTCPNTFVPPSLSYLPTYSGPISLGGGVVAGDARSASIDVTISGDGVGTGTSATSTFGSCGATSGFSIAIGPNSQIGATGTTGAAGMVTLGCVAGENALSGTLSCSENRGGNVTVRQWDLLCPQGLPEAVFMNEFED